MGIASSSQSSGACQLAAPKVPVVMSVPFWRRGCVCVLISCIPKSPHLMRYGTLPSAGASKTRKFGDLTSLWTRHWEWM